MSGREQATIGGVLARMVTMACLTISALLAIPMLVSRLFPEGGEFPAQDSTFFYMTSAQAVVAFVMLMTTVFMRLAGRFWQTAPVFLMVPPAVVLLIAGTEAYLFPEFFVLLLMTGLVVAITALEIEASPERKRARAYAPDGSRTNEAMENVTASSDFPSVRPSKTFADVVGMGELKGRLKAAGEEIVGARWNPGAERNGILLFGDPGNGKTMFAEALAGELKLPMITATFGDVASRWVGQTTEQVMAVFRAAHQQQPCLLFLDEIDSLIKDRNKSMSGGTDEAAKTTNAILTELVNARRSKIVVVAATNFLDRLDQAAIREGRFDFKIEVTAPDELARAAILRHALKPYLAKDVYPDEDGVLMAAKRWEGFSAARIRAVGDEAGRTAANDKMPVVLYEDLQDALRRVQGRSGKLPANTPSLKDLSMPDLLARQLRGIANRMRNIEQVESMGGKVPTGLLFWGAPGTGKTVTARALAKDAGWAFISTSGNDLLGNPDKIDEILREARDIRPTVVFVDEADDVLADRQRARHTASITNRLLTAVDGAGGKVHDIVWIAATNHPEQMDAAALRGGRFTEKLKFELPDQATLATFITMWIAQSKATFSEDLRVDEIVAELDGLSIANVAAALQHAVDMMVEGLMEIEVSEGGPDKDLWANAAVTMREIRLAKSAVVD